jgi:hypothetical protein
MSQTQLCPRGNPLTDTMPFSARDGTYWLAYIEAVPEARGHHQHHPSLPGRRLRFDSAADSRVTTELPSGSPFLTEARLQALLDRAQPIQPPPASTWEPADSPTQVDRAIEWATQAGKLGAAKLAGWSRRWRKGAGRRRALRLRIQQFLSSAFDTALRGVARIRSGRRPPRRKANPPADSLASPSSLARRWRGGRSAHRVRPW